MYPVRCPMLRRMTWPFTLPIKPMKARVRATPPTGEGWMYEPKWDGFRMVAYGGDEVRLDSRNGKDVVALLPGASSGTRSASLRYRRGRRGARRR